MKQLALTSICSFFIVFDICYSQIHYVYNADESELRSAISNANNGDTIMFDLPGYPATINIESMFYLSNKTIAIIGPENESVILESYSDQSGATFLFFLTDNAKCELKNLTLTRQIGGRNNSGQSLIFNNAELHIRNCFLTNVIDSSAQGSIIYNAANRNLIIENSTFSNNFGSQGGAIYNSWDSNLLIKNSTFSGNSGHQGGAIYTAGNLEIESCTFYENHVNNVGGGIFWHLMGGYFNSRNTIYYNSSCFKYDRIINSLGYNLSNDVTYSFNTGSDYNNASNIYLKPLQNNGGSTFTHSLGSCSVAIDNGDPDISGNDQRGFPVYGRSRDIGAYEVQTSLTSSIDTRTECAPFIWIDGNTYSESINTATHTIIGGAVNGCDSLVTLDLTIIYVTDLTTSLNGTTITANNTSASYQWMNCDNNFAVISGETSQSFSPTTIGNYAVQLTENGCVDTSDCVAIITVGILENGFGSNFAIYPNPMQGNFSVDLSSNYETTVISIYDINGRLIQSKSFNQSQLINLSVEEPSGIYLIHIQSGNKKAVVRLVKE